MGLNSTLVIINDTMPDIERDPEFGKKVAEAIRGFNVSARWPYISSGNCANVAEIVGVHHADCFTTFVVGGNTGEELGSAGSWSPQFNKIKQEDRPIWYLKNPARSLGYRIVKLPRKE